MAGKNTFPGELIGMEVEVINSPNLEIIGICGKVVDESKQTLKIKKHNGKTITLLKSSIQFKLLDSGKIISGREIIKRPEDRLK
ncbi:MAG: ribonuclease P protein subunit [Nanoarchaeota archaeon]